MSQWEAKKVAFLGDSITDACHVGTTKNYWQYLSEMLGFESWVYGINGKQWDDVVPQAAKLLREHGGEVDAIFIFMGTNDYNGNVPLGQWWEIQAETVNRYGRMLTLPRRHYHYDPATFRGRINLGLEFVKTHFPDQQIILLTPLHRGFAQFGDPEIQPEESFPNELKLYLENYIEVLREASDIWSVPVIDLYRISGLLPTCNAYTKYFSDAENDRLHPNASGHARIARALAYQLLAMPSDFKAL